MAPDTRSLTKPLGTRFGPSGAAFPTCTERTPACVIVPPHRVSVYALSPHRMQPICVGGKSNSLIDARRQPALKASCHDPDRHQLGAAQRVGEADQQQVAVAQPVVGDAGQDLAQDVGGGGELPGREEGDDVGGVAAAASSPPASLAAQTADTSSWSRANIWGTMLPAGQV